MNLNLSCIIIEDEPLAQDLLEKYIKKLPYLSLIGKFDDAIDGIEGIKKLKPNVVFLDINMPEMTGFELLSIVESNSKPAVIITSGYPEFALESYTYNVVDYLLKPIPFEKFLRAINRLRERLEIGLQTGGNNNSNIAASDDVFLRVGKKTFRFFWEEIFLIEGMKDYLKIHTSNKIHIIHMTMKAMEELVPKNKFIRVSRSFILNKDFIRSIEGNQIELISGSKVDIGVTYREEVILRLNIPN